MYLVFTRMPGENYRRWLMSLLCFCDVFRALVNSLVCWFIMFYFFMFVSSRNIMPIKILHSTVTSSWEHLYSHIGANTKTFTNVEYLHSHIGANTEPFIKVEYFHSHSHTATKRLWFVDTVLWLCPSLPTETLKWFSSLPILMQESFWWWQCGNRYIIPLSPHLHTPLPPFSPSLISLMVSVDVKHNVYFTYSHTGAVTETFIKVEYLHSHIGANTETFTKVEYLHSHIGANTETSLKVKYFHSHIGANTETFINVE